MAFNLKSLLCTNYSSQDFIFSRYRRYLFSLLTKLWKDTSQICIYLDIMNLLVGPIKFYQTVNFGHYTKLTIWITILLPKSFYNLNANCNCQYCLLFLQLSEKKPRRKYWKINGKCFENWGKGIIHAEI